MAKLRHTKQLKQRKQSFLSATIKVCGRHVDKPNDLICLLPPGHGATHVSLGLTTNNEVVLVHYHPDKNEGNPVWLEVNE